MRLFPNMLHWVFIFNFATFFVVFYMYFSPVHPFFLQFENKVGKTQFTRFFGRENNLICAAPVQTLGSFG